MRRQIFFLGCSVVVMAFLSGLSACTSSSGQTGAKGAGRRDSGTRLTNRRGLHPTRRGPNLCPHRRHGDDYPRAHRVQRRHGSVAVAGLLVQ